MLFLPISLSESGEMSLLRHDLHHFGGSEDPHPIPSLWWAALPMWLLWQEVEISCYTWTNSHFNLSLRLSILPWTHRKKIGSGLFGTLSVHSWVVLQWSLSFMSFFTGLRTSAIYKSTQRFTMRAQYIAVRWRVVIIHVTHSQPWAIISKECTRFVSSEYISFLST